MQTIVILLSLLLATIFTAVPAMGFDALVDDNLIPCVSPVPAPPLFLTIQEAVDNAAPGDLIGVCPGTYAEEVAVAKAGLVIEGIGAAKVTAPGGGGPQVGFHVTADDVTIQRLEILGFAGGGSCGVLVEGAHQAAIQNNRVHDNDSGICLVSSNGSRVRSNLVRDNAVHGIEASGVNAVEISNNTVTGNVGTGIFAISVDQVDPSVGVTDIHHNLAAGNGTGGTGDGFEGIQLFIAFGSKVRNNTARGNGSDGILVIHTEGVTVTRNLAQSNGAAGITLHASDDLCTASLNATSFNATEGLRLIDVENCTITRNNSSRNGTFDCFTNDPDANTFLANSCVTESPAGVFD